MTDYREMPENYWKKKLTPKQYKVLREKGTEDPFTGKYVKTNETGMYECAACGNPLFLSNSKFELGKFDPNSGWPSFGQPANRENVELREDHDLGMNRIEVICRRCGSHLGHLFNDGPSASGATGEHYCINSCALNLKKKT